MLVFESTYLRYQGIVHTNCLHILTLNNKLLSIVHDEYLNMINTIFIA